ncbi:MAG: 4-hydroxybenzoate octaprenyltransferase [Gammaproteobacteria bacterium]|nr:MAG: 4-hydroxybenzoate octaprenyltransferase [Gammaproteobacteria bacterium]
MWNAKIRELVILTRLHRPIGILLLLWPMLWGLWLAAEGRPDILVLTVFVLGTVLMRSAGCVINDYADRKIDLHVARTRERPLAAGRISSKEALTLFVLLCLTAFALVSLMNGLTIAMSFAGVFLAASYPFMKRYTYLPQVYLGVAFGWAIPMVFAAQTGTIPTIAWVLFAANVFWVVAYDTAYAMVDREDDIKIGVKSTAILFGQYDRLMIALSHVISLLLLAYAGWEIGLGTVFFLGLMAAAGLAIYQQWLIREREGGACFKAFLNNNWFGVAIFAGIFLHFSL